MTKPTTRKRVIYRIQLTVEAKAQLVEVGNRLGVPQSTIMARLMDWFCKQQAVVRCLMLGLIPAPYASQVAQAASADLD